MRGGRVAVGVGVKTWPGNGVKVGVGLNVGLGVMLPVAVPVGVQVGVSVIMVVVPVTVGVQVAVNVTVNVGVGFPWANNTGKAHGHWGISDIVTAASAIMTSAPCFAFTEIKRLSTLNYTMMTRRITSFTLFVRNCKSRTDLIAITIDYG